MHLPYASQAVYFKFHKSKMVILDSTPGFSVDIRSATNDNIAFPEYNQGDENPHIWPSNVESTLVGGPADGEVVVVNTKTPKQPKRNTKSRQPAAPKERKAPTRRSTMKKPKAPDVNLDSICKRYIEASPTPFKICFICFLDFRCKRYDIRAVVSIDGIEVSDKTFQRHNLMIDHGPGGWPAFLCDAQGEREMPGGRGRKEYIEKPFMFSRLDTGKMLASLKVSYLSIWFAALVRNQKVSGHLAEALVPRTAHELVVQSSDADTYRWPYYQRYSPVCPEHIDRHWQDYHKALASQSGTSRGKYQICPSRRSRHMAVIQK